MKTLKIFALALISALSLNSCLVDDEDSRAETLSGTPLVFGFASSQRNISHFSDVGIVEYDLNVETVGGSIGTSTSDMTITYEIDPASTATQGVEYTLPAGNTIDIQAGVNINALKLSVNTGSLNPTQPTELILNLVPNGIVVPDSKKTIRVVFVGCTSNNAGAYTSAEVIAAGAPNVTITEVDTNLYEISAMPFLAFGGAGGGPVTIQFSNICGELQFTGWQLNTLVVGSGTVDPVTGALNFDAFTIYNGDTVSSGAWFNLPASTYTPN